MDIRVGDRVTYKFTDKEHTVIIANEDELKLVETMEIIKIERTNWKVVGEIELKEELTDEEKQLLKLLIKLINTDIKFIEKQGRKLFLGGTEFNLYNMIVTNYFRGLKDEKLYTLSELGLEE